MKSFYTMVYRLGVLNYRNIFFVISITLMLALCAWRPPDFLQDLQQKYDAYKKKYPPVKLHFIFNQPLFSPGDTVFFQSWYLNEAFLPVKGEHVVTLDLRDGSGGTRHKIKFKVKNGNGHSQFVINKELPAGEYEIVAYTDWMRNFPESWFYKRKLSVVSTKQIKATSKDGLAFYPEGGNLVAGTANKVFVVGPPSTRLQLRTSSDSAMAGIEIDSTGFGSFTIKPGADEQYFVEWPKGGRRWKLPASKKDGLSLVMDAQDSLNFVLSLPSNSQWINKEMYAVVNSGGNITFSQKIVLGDTQHFELNVPLKDNKGALHQFTIFDAQGKVVAQRLFFTRRQALTTKIHIGATAAQRDRIAAAVQILDASGHAVDSDVSVVVYQAGLFQGAQMSADFYLADLPEAEARAQRYHITDNFFLNDFLATQKLEQFDWQQIISDQAIPLVYPFYGEQRLKGKIVSKKDGTPCPDSTSVIGYLQTNTVGYEAYTKDGKFDMPLIYDFWDEDKVFCTLKYKGKSIDDSYDIIILKDSLAPGSVWTSVETEQNSFYGQYALNRNIVTRSYNFFQAEAVTSTAKDQSANSAFEDEFLGADYEVNVEEYMTFPNMADFLQEAVPFVNYRKRGGKETIRMSYRYEKSLKIFRDEPLYIIDGLMTKNTAYFLSLRPEQLLFIKVLNNPNKLMQLGKLGENAVIFVESKKGDLYKAFEGENIFPVVGLSRAKEFFEYDHSHMGIDSRVPDMRSTLYWKPLLETKSGVAEFNFFASDDIGPMKVLVTGITKDGRPFKVEKEINIVFNE